MWTPQVAALFDAIRTGAPKLTTLRAGTLGIMKDGDSPALSAVALLLKRPSSEGEPLKLCDLRGNKFPLSGEALEVYSGCKVRPQSPNRPRGGRGHAHASRRT